MVRRVLFVLAIGAVLSSGCSDPGGVEVTLDEYSLDVDPTTATSGRITLDARNVGAIAHQLVALRTARDDEDLPVRDGTVRTNAKGIDVMGEVDLIASNDSETLAVTLPAGRYVLICNIAGHYSSGMRAPFRVSR